MYIVRQIRYKQTTHYRLSKVTTFSADYRHKFNTVRQSTVSLENHQVHKPLQLDGKGLEYTRIFLEKSVPTGL